MENGNYYQSPQAGLSSLSGILGNGIGQCAVEDELSKLLREYRDAKTRFDTACLNAQSANNERMAAADAMNKISDILQKTVEVGRFDKTQPMAAEAKTPYPR